MKFTETKRGKVLLGEIPPEFLRLQSPSSQPDAGSETRNDQAVAQQLSLQQHQALAQTATLATSIRLTITIMEAKLNKNYGVTRMDPYCRLQVGQSVYETATAQNGAKLPYWGKAISATVEENLKSIGVEIFDERAFSTDNRIAWGQVVLTDALKGGKSEDDWWPLSGKLGEDKEGMVHLQLSWTKEQRPVYYNAPMPMMFPQMTPMVMSAQGYIVPPGIQVGGHVPQQYTRNAASAEQDFKQVKEMFPNVEDAVIKTILEASQGNKAAAINSLLSMEQ